MRNIINLVIFVAFSIISFACNTNTKGESTPSGLPIPKIEMGTATLSGRIQGYGINDTIAIIVPNPVTSEPFSQEISINDNGNFSVDILMEISPNIGYMFTKEERFTISLETNKETEISVNGESIETISGPDFYTQSYERIFDILDEIFRTGYINMYDHLTRDSVKLYIENPNRIHSLLKYDLDKKLDGFRSDSTLSEIDKAYLTYDINAMHLETFKYDEVIRVLERGTRTKDDTIGLDITNKPDRAYYTFLKEFDLNNPLYLYSSHYSDLCKSLLRNKTLNIPEIKDTPIKEWLDGVKNTMTDLIGVDKGFFYNMLIATAYSNQLNNYELLSDKQIQNIKEYYNNTAMGKILLCKDEEVKKMAIKKGKVVTNETPAVSNDKVLDAIINNNKGKTVVVDFWATWCGPCLKAMKEMVPLKSELNSKNVVFIYITTTSSPKDLWEDKIKGIDGEHYYLNKEQWEYILNKFNIQGIPAYLIYDKNGKLSDSVIGYPGTESMKKMVEKVL